MRSVRSASCAPSDLFGPARIALRNYPGFPPDRRGGRRSSERSNPSCLFADLVSAGVECLFPGDEDRTSLGLVMCPSCASGQGHPASTIRPDGGVLRERFTSSFSPLTQHLWCSYRLRRRKVREPCEAEGPRPRTSGRFSERHADARVRTKWRGPEPLRVLTRRVGRAPEHLIRNATVRADQ